MIVVAGIAIAAGYAIRLYQAWRFELQSDALYLERGVITFVETAVPFVRVQHVDTQFGPIERLLGLSSVVVYTAGSRNADVRIPGLTPDRARDLQDTLRELAVEAKPTTPSNMNRLHPLSAVTMVIQQAITWVTIPFFLVVFLSGIVDVVEYSWVFVLVPLGLLLGTTYALVYYYRFEYGITPDTFDVRSGVFSRRSGDSYGRIQNVDIARGVVQRLLGLAVVSIETAGGGNTEATLRFVSESEANRLQHQIRRRTAEATERRRRRADTDSDAVESGESPLPDDSVAGTPGEESASDPDFERADGTATAESGPQISESDSRTYESRRRRLFDLEARELLLYSFTSFRPAAVAAVLFVFFLATDTILDVLVTIAQPVGGPEDLENGTTGSYGVLTIVSMVNGLVITYLLSVAYTFATYYDFQLGRIDEDFVYEQGLLQRYSGSIPVEKVQSVTVTANPVQRLIEYAGLWVETAGYGPDSGSGSQSAVPLADRRRVYAFTENLTGVERPRFHTHPPSLGAGISSATR